jgi:hypothetical protein
MRIRNSFDTTHADCRVEVQISAAQGSAGPGVADQWVNGNLPTENDGGTFLGLNASTTRVLPVVVGSNTVYLNGETSCAGVLIGPLTITATLVQNNPSATLAVP